MTYLASERWKAEAEPPFETDFVRLLSDSTADSAQRWCERHVRSSRVTCKMCDDEEWGGVVKTKSLRVGKMR